MRMLLAAAIALGVTGAAIAQLKPRPVTTAAPTGTIKVPPQLKLPHTLTVMSVKSDSYSVRLATMPASATPMTCTIMPKDVYPQGRGAVICKFKFAGGTAVQLTATKVPNDGSAETPVADWQWTNDCAGTKGTVCNLTMDKDRTAEMTTGLL